MRWKWVNEVDGADGRIAHRGMDQDSRTRRILGEGMEIASCFIQRLPPGRFYPTLARSRGRLHVYCMDDGSVNSEAVRLVPGREAGMIPR